MLFRKVRLIGWVCASCLTKSINYVCIDLFWALSISLSMLVAIPFFLLLSPLSTLLSLSLFCSSRLPSPFLGFRVYQLIWACFFHFLFPYARYHNAWYYLLRRVMGMGNGKKGNESRKNKDTWYFSNDCALKTQEPWSVKCCLRLDTWKLNLWISPKHIILWLLNNQQLSVIFKQCIF
jgi:hypothetical protein